MAGKVPANFQVDLSGGYFGDPSTGQIFDSGTGQTFASADELEATSQGVAQAEASQSSSSGMSGLAGGGSALSAAYLANSLVPKGGAAAAAATPTTAAPVAETVASSAASAGATTGSQAGVLLSTGEVIPVGAAIPEGATAIGSAPLATGSGLTGGAFGSALGMAGIPAGAYTGYQQFRGAENILKDKKPSMLQHAALFPLTGGFDVLARPFLGNGKDKYQRGRDKARGGMREGGRLDDAYTRTLSSGATHDFGKDGKHMLTNSDGSQRHFYDVDFSRADSGQLTAMLDPLGLAEGGNRKTGSDMTGNFVNLAQNAGNSLENVRELYSDYDYNTLRELIDQSSIEQADKDAMFNTIDDVYGVNAYAGKGSAFDRGGLSSAAPMSQSSVPAPKPQAASVPQSQIPKPAVTTPGGVQMTAGPRPTIMGNRPASVPSGTMPGAKTAMPGASMIPRLPVQVRGQTAGPMIPKPMVKPVGGAMPGQGRAPIDARQRMADAIAEIAASNGGRNPAPVLQSPRKPKPTDLDKANLIPRLKQFSARVNANY